MRLLVVAALLHWILATDPEEHGPRYASKGLHENPEENSLLQMQALPARRRGGARSTNTTSKASQPMEAVATLYELAADTLTVAFSDPEPLKPHPPQASRLSFLVKYFLWSLLVVVGSSCAKGRWYTPALKDGGFDADAPSLLPVQVAYLAAGPVGAVRSSLLMLIYEGMLEARPLACKNPKTLCLLRAVSNPAGHLSLILSKQDTASEGGIARDMEHRLREAIMEALGKSKDGHVDLVELARGPLQEHLDEIQRGLVEQQLLMSTVTWRAAQGLPALPLCLLLFVGLAQAQHLPGHLGLALPMVLITVVASLLTNPRLSHRTSHGDKALGFYDIGSVKARGTIGLPEPATESIFLAREASKEPAPEPAPDAASQSASSEAASVDVAMVFALYGLDALVSNAASRPELATLEGEPCP